METISKSKSSSTLPKSTERLDIKEITDDQNLLPEPSGYIVITEVPSDSENHSKNVAESSVTIEDMGKPEAINLESAESSDNISQYLDKEEIVEPLPSTTSKTEETNGRQERAKSEEPKRKRKLSIDSSYSRKSLSKLAILKKLKEAKEKMKVPKLLKKQKSTEASTKPEIKPQDISTHFKPDSKQKPVYIHIPLKPPEGETDEFSYLEFGEKQPEPLKEEKEPEKPPEEIPKIEIEETYHDERRFSGDPNEIVAFEILKTDTIDLEHASKNGLQGGSDYLIIQQDDDAKSENMIIIMPNEEEPTSSLKPPSRQGSRKIRAKSAEPERKRKLSLESSYSGRSLSKLGLVQKLKDAKDKLKFPKLSLSRSGSKKEKKEEKEAPPKQELKKPETSSNEPKYIHIPLKPPPGQSDEFSYLEHEEKKEEPKVEKTEDTKAEESSVESPTSPKTEGVQFISLTPPSDDEVLKDVEVPETPSSEPDETRIHELKKIAKDAVEKVSPETRKKLLQPVTEEDIETKSEKQSFTEEDVETKSEKMVVDEEDGLKLTESAMAKQEQNVKSKEVEEIKSSLKTEGSPVLKKKVSFKRRSRDDSKDGDYEDIQAPVKETEEIDDKSKLEVMGNSQSMSVDEEKSYLDEQKIIKSTSLEEDYNRWSKLR